MLEKKKNDDYKLLAGKVYTLGCMLEDAHHAGDMDMIYRIAAVIQCALWEDGDDPHGWSVNLGDWRADDEITNINERERRYVR